MNEIASSSVELILADLPYQVTSHHWDSIIPLKPLWEAYRRIITPTGAIVLTATQPFTTVLAASNLEWLKYEWIWMKNRPTNFAQSKNKPMSKHENILVFSPGTTVHKTQSRRRMTYNPQGLIDIEPKRVTKRASEKTDTFFSDRPSHGEFVRSQTNFPHSILEFSTEQMGMHPTQKPVALFRYLVRTYSEPGETVMDNCLGSGTTGVAALSENRRFIGIERDDHYFAMSRDRILAEK